MKFIRFTEATQFLKVPAGDVPFVIEEGVAVLRVELDDKDIQELKRLGGKMYLVMPAPAGVVVPPVLSFKSPFAPQKKVIIMGPHGQD